MDQKKLIWLDSEGIIKRWPTVFCLEDFCQPKGLSSMSHCVTSTQHPLWGRWDSLILFQNVIRKRLPFSEVWNAHLNQHACRTTHSKDFSSWVSPSAHSLLIHLESLCFKSKSCCNAHYCLRIMSCDDGRAFSFSGFPVCAVPSEHCGPTD